jgi:hypothetical protein
MDDLMSWGVGRRPPQKLQAEVIKGGIGGRGREAADGLEVRRIEETVVAIEGGHWG